MTSQPLPTDEQVRAAAEQLLAAHREGGPYPTVTALAKQFRINRTTFYRHFAVIAEFMLDTANRNHSDGPRRRRPPHHDDERDQIIRRLRDENSDLRRHVEIYEEHLRMLTTENARLTVHLQQLAGITELGVRRAQQQPSRPGRAPRGAHEVVHRHVLRIRVPGDELVEDASVAVEL